MSTPAPAGILYPSYGGRRGHPPLIAATYAGEILGEAPAAGLRDLLLRHEADARHVECDDPGILVDFDTEAEYRQARGLGLPD